MGEFWFFGILVDAAGVIGWGVILLYLSFMFDLYPLISKKVKIGHASAFLGLTLQELVTTFSSKKSRNSQQSLKVESTFLYALRYHRHSPPV